MRIMRTWILSSSHKPRSAPVLGRTNIRLPDGVKHTGAAGTSPIAAPEDGRAPLKRRSVPFLSQITHLRYTYLKPSLWGILTEYENLNARLAIRIGSSPEESGAAKDIFLGPFSQVSNRR